TPTLRFDLGLDLGRADGGFGCAPTGTTDGGREQRAPHLSQGIVSRTDNPQPAHDLPPTLLRMDYAAGPAA
ncbi:MAG: hypothetical protein OXJ62_04755, partial [Spirochaetaceae bacterium]|nr:hypothetical protein [Spirochaetaceae bacterium]